MTKKLRILPIVMLVVLLFGSMGTVYADGTSPAKETSWIDHILGWFGSKPVSQPEKVVSLGSKVKIVSDPLPKNTPKATNEPTVIEQDTTAKVINEKGKVVGQKHIAKTPKAAVKSKNRVVTAVIAADEEYRRAYPDWQNRTKEIVEKADNAFIRDHQVDFKISGYLEWKSDGYNGEQILQDLDRDKNKGIYDFVIGFTKDAYFNYGGIAYMQPTGGPGGSAVSVTADMHPNAIWHVVQHELSHNFGVPHDLHGPQYERCIMNYYYTTQVDIWDEKHNQIIERNKYWYGNRQNNQNDQNDQNNNNKPNKPDVPTSNPSSFETQVVQLVNQERTRRGYKPLQMDAKLSQVARLKSEDMRDNNYFSHQSPTYGSPFDMMRKFGIQYTYAGENIAAGQQTPQDVMNSWMNSPGHRSNILNPNYTTIGVGFAKGGSYGTYWTQQFIRR
ncbi:hypothetical protein GIJ05_06750 [Laceyella tengchongensis]|nr:hypothetical protein [Laceyella tengchongensis]